MLKIRPFHYGLILNQVYDNGSVFSPAVLDITDDDIVKVFCTVSISFLLFAWWYLKVFNKTSTEIYIFERFESKGIAIHKFKILAPAQHWQIITFNSYLEFHLFNFAVYSRKT